MAEQQSLTPWADLPNKLLNYISKKLHLCDYLNFRLVCATWREAAKQLGECVQSPLLMPPHCKDDCCRWFLCPLDGRRCKINQPMFDMRYQCIGTFHGWLLMINPSERDTMFLSNPFTGARINLPQWDGTKFISSIVISSAPTDPDCTVIIFVIEGVQFCRVGDDEWTEEYIAYPILMDGLVFRGKFYLLCNPKPVSNPQSVIRSITHLKIEYLDLPKYPCDRGLSGLHLVESCGEMLLILLMGDGLELIRKPVDIPKRKVDSLLVFKLDMKTSSWVEIEGIGNQVLFLGFGCSKSFSAAELGCKGNQIHFIELTPLQEEGLDIWDVYDMEDGSIQRICTGLRSTDPFLSYGCCMGCEQKWVTPNFGSQQFLSKI